MELKTNWIKAYIIDVLPCITVAVYILAFVYNIAFFSVFNINIVHYLSLGDMLFSIMDVLVAFAFISLIAIWFGMFYVSVFIINEESEAKICKRDKDRISSFSYRTLRRIAKIRSYRPFSVILKILKRWEKRGEERFKKREERRIELEKDQNYHSWDRFIGAVLLSVISFLLFLEIQKSGKIDKGIMGATIGLVIPIVLYALIPIAKDFDSMIFPGMKHIRKIKKFKPIEVLEMVIVLYFYSITVFYVSGIDSGVYYKNNDLATFSIKTNDGQCFNDSCYRYINHINEKVFLLEKKSNSNVILTNEGITYMVVNYKGDSNNSIIVRLVNLIQNEHQ